jgi:site-specific DNA-methyltransferase (adenine-specific)
MSEEKTIRINCQGAELLPISFLNELQGGLKELSKTNEKKLRKNILELGFSEPVTIWKKGEKYYIVNGHQRVKVLGKMAAEGYDIPKIPANIVEAKDEAEAKRLVLSLTSQFGEITEKGMLAFAEEAGLALKDIDESFSFPEVDVGKLILADEDDPEKDDAMPEPAADPVAKPGEIYQLGNHRLMCGNSAEKADVEKLMGGQIADFVMADPPYNVQYVGGSGNKKERSDSYADGMATEEYEKFLVDVFTNAGALSEPTAALHTWLAASNIKIVIAGFEKAGWRQRSLIVWNKLKAHYGALGAQYKHKHEPMFYCHKVGQAPQWYGETTETTVWEYEQPRVNDLHPTMKPVGLYCISVKNHTAKGQLVYEIFGGSGTTIIACEKLDRRCCAMEKNPVYVDVIIKRWEEYTSKKAELISG